MGFGAFFRQGSLNLLDTFICDGSLLLLVTFKAFGSLTASGTLKRNGSLTPVMLSGDMIHLSILLLLDMLVHCR